ncbi:MAG: glycoside hydrolase family 2 protein, partial [Chloroflexota bacterium]
MPYLSLNGSAWRLGAVDRAPLETYDFDLVSEWLPATVPGDVRVDLQAAGLIPDPLEQPAASEWVDRRDWWYARELPGGLQPGQRAFVLLDGVDYLSCAYLDGDLLGTNAGMFGRLAYEVTPYLGQIGVLAIRLAGGGALPRLHLGRRQRALRWLARRLAWGELYPDRLATLKCQMSYGWDFAPALLTTGLWDDTWLHICDVVRIERAHARPLGLDDPTEVELTLDLDAAEACRADLDVEISGENFPWGPLSLTHPLALASGKHSTQLRLHIPEPRLWEPWDRGEPNLYRLRLTLRQGERVLDEWSDTFGLCQVRLLDNPDPAEGGSHWTFEVNGRREFARGANWVPADSLFGRLRPPDYEDLVRLARQANINMLRVWGGGLREKRAFYDACDREGILVWQEFPLACAFVDDYPADKEFLDLTAREARGIVQSVRQHPCLALWCGGNEINPRRSRKLVGVLADAVTAHDGDRPFRPASPSPGDVHHWRVWNGKANIADYRQVRAGFLSEFGLQSPPDEASLCRFLPPGEVWPPGQAWEARKAQLDKLARYARPLRPSTLHEFVAATQR